MGRFEGKHVVITGACEGLGRSIAVSFAQEGAALVLVDRQDCAETAAAVSACGGIICEQILCDITREEQVIKMGKSIGRIFSSKIDILVNNAGFNGKSSLVENMKLKDWEYTISVDLTGTMLVCRELIPHMASPGGAILNVSSNVARRGLPYRSDYVCSKWAVLGLTQTLALELADRNIRVNAVCPGPINGERVEQLVRMHSEAEGIPFDEMHKSWANVPMKRFIEPEEVTSVIQFLCSKESGGMTGQALNVTGGALMT